MHKFFRRVISLCLLAIAAVCATRSQVPAGTAEFYRHYNEAQRMYDRATSLGKRLHYGAREEALEREWNHKALNAFQALYRSLASQPYQCDSLRFYTAFRVGELQHYFENFSEAVSFYRQAIAAKEKSRLPDSLLFKPLLYAGIIFYNQNKFDTAVQFFKRAEAVQAAYGNRLTEAERLYNILGVLFYERGNYRQAQNYFQKALALLPPSNPYYNELFVNYKINLAQLHTRLEEYDQAMEIYRELLPRRINPNEIYHNIGTLNLSVGAAAQALSYFKKVSYANNKVVRLYNSTGQAYFNLYRFDSALHYYQRAVNAYTQLGTNADPVGYGLVLKNLGDYYLQTGNDSVARSFYQKAVHQFYPAFKSENALDNPRQFSGVFSYINLFNVLHAKAEAWHARYIRTNNLAAAREELRVYQSAFALIDYVERTYDSDEARLFLTKTKHAVHSKPIDVAFALYQRTGDKSYLATLYAFDQQNKAAILALNRQQNTAPAENASPAMVKERQVKTEITRLSIRAAQVTDSLQLTNLNTRIRDQEIELGKLQESRSPHLQGSRIPSIESLQSGLLDDHTVLVSYHLSPDKLTTLVLTKKAASCYQQNLPDDFTETVLQQILLLKRPSGRPLSKPDQALYSLLMAGVPLQETKQLIIIPDDVLSYFPFESLQGEAGTYLVQQVAIQYQFSTALLGKNEGSFSGAETVSFAPFAHRGIGSLPALPASAEEAAAAKGRRFLDEAATKDAFLQYSGTFRTVHLATHAIANSDAGSLSYIVFAPDRGKENLLYAQEIYNLHLPKTSLVILSACETGTGNLIKGEGVLSLSRAFAYAGCPNIITSLWKADDFSTAYLTGRVHHYLDEGRSIATAVQQAKVDYLADKSVNPRLKQPYYWAHLVFIGNYAPDGSSKTWLLAAATTVALLIVLLFFIRKRSRLRDLD